MRVDGSWDTSHTFAFFYLDILHNFILEKADSGKINLHIFNEHQGRSNAQILEYELINPLLRRKSIEQHEFFGRIRIFLRLIFTVLYLNF